MKEKIIIIALVLCLCVCALTCEKHATNDINEGPKIRTFGKFYKSYELNIEPKGLSYKLPLCLKDIVNIQKMKQLIESSYILSLIHQNGFAIVQPKTSSPLNLFTRSDFVSTYTLLADSRNIPFVTTDTGFYLYHTLFDETLRDIEERKFIPDINSLTAALLNDAFQQYEQFQDDLKEAARRNIAYLSVAQKLLTPNSSVPELVNDIVISELAKIEAHGGFNSSDIFIYDEDYSQYVPRGHYRRNDALKRYFKTMMWYGRMAFLLRGGPEGLISQHDANIQTLQSFLLAVSLKNIKIGEKNGLDIWEGLYTVTSFCVGMANDLTPYDYIWALDHVFEDSLVLSDLKDTNNLLKLKEKLALLPSPKIYGGIGNIVLAGPITNESLNEVLDKSKGMRFMGRRFVPDSYMFQHLVFPEVGSYLGDSKSLPFTAGQNGNRVYIRGLDLMALLGSDEAQKILDDEGDTNYRNYKQKFHELKNELDSLSLNGWNKNLYWSLLYCLRALLKEFPEGYPEFMRTQAWNRRQLNMALASWTQLRRDTILYTEQGYPPPPAGRLPTPPPGYVEPNLLFWGRLLSLTRMTSQGFDSLGVLTPKTRQRFTELDKLLQQVLDISGRQLNNNPLSLRDREFFKKLSSRLKLIVKDVRGQCLTTTFVVDVHTNPLENKVVEEAIGKIDLIIVACPMPEDKAFLAIGQGNRIKI